MGVKPASAGRAVFHRKRVGYDRHLTSCAEQLIFSEVDRENIANGISEHLAVARE